MLGNFFVFHVFKTAQGKDGFAFRGQVIERSVHQLLENVLVVIIFTRPVVRSVELEMILDVDPFDPFVFFNVIQRPVHRRSYQVALDRCGNIQLLALVPDMDKNLLDNVIGNRFIVYDLVGNAKQALVIFLEQVLYVDEIAQCKMVKQTNI